MERDVKVSHYSCGCVKLFVILFLCVCVRLFSPRADALNTDPNSEGKTALNVVKSIF